MSATANVTELPQAFAEQRLVQRLRDDPVVYRALRALFIERREQRRTQAEAATGETGQVLRGRCVELSAILNEVFPDVKEA